MVLAFNRTRLRLRESNFRQRVAPKRVTGERITRTGMVWATLCHTTGTRRRLPPAADARDDGDNEDAMFFELRRLIDGYLVRPNGPGKQSR